MGVRLVPREELDRREREFHAAKTPPPPKPNVINVDAVLVFGQARVFEFGGVGYRAPPLTYPQGIRLLVAAHALEDLIEQKAGARVVQQAARVAALSLRGVVSPVRRWRYLTAWRRPFLQAPVDELLGLLRWLVMVPDAASYQPPTKKETHDYVDALFAFARAYPALMRDGHPLSWAHYLYGNRHLGRAQVREDLRASSAARVSQAEQKEYRRYAAEMRAAAGW